MPSVHAGTQSPPRSFGATIRCIGPGFILAGALVGSGELIATTATGAESGFSLLWLIILGCVIKVFVQVELGRQAITYSESSLSTLNQVPGPRIQLPFQPHGKKVRANWIVICWLMMFIATIFLFGGIIGGIGQSLAMTFPLTQEGKAYNHFQDQSVALSIKTTELEAATTEADQAAKSAAILDIESSLAKLAEPSPPMDAHYWAALITFATVLVLVFGKYGFIEKFSVVLVGSFTAITIYNLIQLQGHPGWAISGSEIADGLRFSLPTAIGDRNPMLTALATFGIIGVGASDLVAYPYWCLEKGYARWTGKNDGSGAWEDRAKGWLRVLKWDAWSACLLYTFTTVAFYLLGAAVLGRVGLIPEGSEMIRTLAVMYEPVFGSGAQVLFLFGAIAVLYSTFFIGNAGHCRLATDVLCVLNISSDNERSRSRLMTSFAIILPILCVGAYYTVGSPVVLVLVGGIAQALLLPMVAFAALYFRHRKCHPALRPGRLWDAMLAISFVAFVVVGIYLVYVNLS
jgi:Mn2+/Fe2+ NRAMP family transporter